MQHISHGVVTKGRLLRQGSQLDHHAPSHLLTPLPDSSITHPPYWREGVAWRRSEGRRSIGTAPGGIPTQEERDPSRQCCYRPVVHHDKLTSPL